VIVVVLPQTCRHAAFLPAAARVRDACIMQVFLVLGKATRGHAALQIGRLSVGE